MEPAVKGSLSSNFEYGHTFCLVSLNCTQKGPCNAGGAYVSESFLPPSGSDSDYEEEGSKTDETAHHSGEICLFELQAQHRCICAGNSLRRSEKFTSSSIMIQRNPSYGGRGGTCL